MAAQTVKDMPLAEAKALVAGGQEIRPGTYALRSRGVTVTVRQTATPGIVRVLVTKGCAC